MRIITGEARGAVLQTLEGEATRPTAERVKEAVFSALQFELEGIRFLDLFAGSGQMGLEAVSRGAACAVLVDASPDAVAVIKANAKKTRLFDRCRIVNYQYTDYLRGFSRSGEAPFDIVYIDPPFPERMHAEVLRRLADSGAVGANTKVIAESEDADALFGGDDSLAARYVTEKLSRYGRISVSYLRLREKEEETE